MTADFRYLWVGKGYIDPSVAGSYHIGALKGRSTLSKAFPITLLAHLLCSGPVGPIMVEMISLSMINTLVMVEPMSIPAKYSDILF